MTVSIEEDNLKQGLLGLVVGLVEIIQEVLERQALRRIEGGRLNEQEIERLGEALSDLNSALENIKIDNDLEEAVKSIREGLDQVADEVLDKFTDPEKWGQEGERV